MSDSIVPNPPFLKQLQQLDAAEIAAARQILQDIPSLWHFTGGWSTAQTGWSPVGRGQLVIDADESGHLQQNSDFFQYLTVPGRYYRFDFNVNGTNESSSSQILGIGITDNSNPFTILSNYFNNSPPLAAGANWLLGISGVIRSSVGLPLIPVILQQISNEGFWDDCALSIQEVAVG